MTTRLIEKLQDVRLYSHPVSEFRVIETHISWVLLTGPFAYKIRKPVNFGFLDFTRLEQRLLDCQEELRLNHRLAAPLYRGLVSITGSHDHPLLEGTGAAIEYAVKMVQFPQEDLLDARLQQGILTAEPLEALAESLAHFHAHLPGANPDSPYGTPAAVIDIALQNFEQIRPRLSDNDDLEQLGQLEAWTHQEFHRLEPILNARHQQGKIRECHGDLHLGNLVWFEHRPLAFDCIEFNPRYRWIDPINDLAFLVMDLHHRQRPDLAQRLLNRYLEVSGDDEALQLLRFYLSYRALVRAKITLLSCPAGQSIDDASLNRYRQYAALAEKLSQPAPAKLLLMHGVSGSGKSTVARRLAEQGNWVQMRSDAERQQLHSTSDLADLPRYGQQLTQLTYQRLHRRAQTVLAAGWPVVIDATFLTPEHRQAFAALARAQSTELRLISCQAPHRVLESRLCARKQAGGDPSEADALVLSRQLTKLTPLSATEAQHTWILDTSDERAITAITATANAWLSS